MKIKSTATIAASQQPLGDPTRETDGQWLLDIKVKSHITFSIPQCVVTPESEVSDVISAAIRDIPKLRYGAYTVYNISAYVRECLDDAAKRHTNRAKIMNIANAYVYDDDDDADADMIASQWTRVTDHLRTIRLEGLTGAALEAAQCRIQSVASREMLKRQVFIQLCMLAISNDAEDIYVAIGHGLERKLARHRAGKDNDDSIAPRVMQYLDNALDRELDMEEEAEAEAQAEAQAQAAPRHDMASLARKLSALQVILREIEKAGMDVDSPNNKAEATARVIDALSAQETVEDAPKLSEIQEYMRKWYDN